MGEELPEIVDARRVADDSGALEGRIPARRLARIAAPFRALGPVQVAFTIERRDAARLRLSGRLHATVAATCQRCLGEMTLALERDVDVVLAEDEGSADPEDDVVGIPDGRFEVVRFVEDEVMLACPMIPMHPAHECDAAPGPGAASDERRRPFADLARLMAESKRDENR